MTTKQQEREALTKIRKIVEALGEDSYVGTAFKGVFAIAEQNIDMDAAFSLGEEVEIAQRDARDAKAKFKTTQEAYDSLSASYKQLGQTYDALLEKHSATLYDLTSAVKERDDALAKNAEIIILKAKLYDLMTSGAA